MILYEDAALVVLDKPAGLSSEEGVPAALRKHWGRPDAYVGVIHRLDTGVSGLMVYAKTPQAAAALSRQVARASSTMPCRMAGPSPPPMRRTHRPSGRSTAPSSRAGRTKRSPPEASCATTYSRTAGGAGSSRSFTGQGFYNITISMSQKDYKKYKKIISQMVASCQIREWEPENATVSESIENVEKYSK